MKKQLASGIEWAGIFAIVVGMLWLNWLVPDLDNPGGWELESLAPVVLIAIGMVVGLIVIVRRMRSGRK